MQQMVQSSAVPDVSSSTRNEIVRKRSATSNDSSFDEGEDNDQSVPKQGTGNSTKVSRSNPLEDQIVKLIETKVDSINANFKKFLKEVKVIKEEIGAYANPALKGTHAKKIPDGSHQDEVFDEQFMNWQIEAQEMKKTLNWSPLDDIMVHSQAFRKAANNEKQSLQPAQRVIFL